MSRFYITELRGDLTPRERSGYNNKTPVGVSFHIIDRLWNHRLVATYRTEDYRGERSTAPEREDKARRLAEAHLARLEA